MQAEKIARLESRIAELESENELLRSELNIRKPKRQQERAFTLTMIVNYNKQPQEEEEDVEYVDFVFFEDKRLSTMDAQNKLRRVLRSVLPRMDAESGRDWVAVYIAYHYYIDRQLIMKGQSDFFKDIHALLPGVLTRVNEAETSNDKRFKAYADLLRLECPKWFILDECLPPMQEWTSKRFDYRVDDARRKRIQQLVKDIYQGLKKEGL